MQPKSRGPGPADDPEKEKAPGLAAQGAKGVAEDAQNPTPEAAARQALTPGELPSGWSGTLRVTRLKKMGQGVFNITSEVLGGMLDGRKVYFTMRGLDAAWIDWLQKPGGLITAKSTGSGLEEVRPCL